jgi:hypothetical protein
VFANNKIFLPLIIFLFSSWHSYAQDYENEQIHDADYFIGINFNTNAGNIGGLVLRHTRYIKKNQYHLFGFEWVNVKHAQEERIVNVYTGSTFLIGKSKYLLPMRFSYGREFVLFPKDREEGVQISALFKGGPSLGIQKAYYILYDYTDYSVPDPISRVRSEPYDVNRHTQYARILGTGSFMKGLFNSDVTFGLHASASVSFNFINYNNNITGIEAGFNIEAYPKKIEIIPQAQNRWVYSSVFLNILYGRRH